MRNALFVLAALASWLGAQPVHMERLRADVSFLASAPLEGRRALERGSEVAAEFIAAEFAKAGLQPAAGGSYFQRFELLEYRMQPEAAQLTVETGQQRLVFEYGRDFSGSFPRAIAVRAPLAFAGYGITAPEYGYDDYAAVDVRGKVALIFESEPRAHDPGSPFHGVGNSIHAAPRRKTLNAQGHGAVAVLMIPAPNRKRPFRPGRGGRVQAPAESEVRIPLFTLSPEAAEKILKAAGRTPAELQSALDAALQPTPVLLQAQVELRVTPAAVQRGVTANVAAVLEGADPRLRRETVLFCAHYDHLGTREGRWMPGADDNASGVAALLELARLFAQGKPLRRTLLFVAFGAEEAGLLGSYYYTEHPLRPLETTRAVLNLDMVGRDEKPSAQTDKLIEIAPDTSNEVNLVGASYSPDLRAAIERANRAVGLRLNDKWDRDGTLNVLWRCDHFPFLLRGIPAVWLFNGFTPDYHTPQDTPEKLNYGKMQKIVRLAWRAGRALAQSSRSPRFKP